MAHGMGIDPPSDLRLLLHQGIRLDVPASVAELRAIVADARPVLVVLDPLVMLHSGDENKPSEMARVIRPLTEIAAEFETCVVIVHHVNKPSSDRKPTRLAQRFRGASSFAGATDANVILDRVGDSIHVRAEFRDAEDTDLWLELDPDTLLLEETLAPTKAGAKVTAGELLAYIGNQGEVGAKDTAERFSVSRNTAKAALTGLVSEGRLETWQQGYRGEYRFRVRGLVNASR
jgi:AAA domain